MLSARNKVIFHNHKQFQKAWSKHRDGQKLKGWRKQNCKWNKSSFEEFEDYLIIQKGLPPLQLLTGMGSARIRDSNILLGLCATGCGFPQIFLLHKSHCYLLPMRHSVPARQSAAGHRGHLTCNELMYFLCHAYGHSHTQPARFFLLPTPLPLAPEARGVARVIPRTPAVHRCTQPFSFKTQAPLLYRPEYV